MNVLFSLQMLTGLSLLIWLVLLMLRGQFWRVNGSLEASRDADAVASTPEPARLPSVCVVIPARNEAEVLRRTLATLLRQSYGGALRVLLIDDQSEDGTAAVARRTATELGRGELLEVLPGTPLPPGWSGKLWALEQGVRQAAAMEPPPIYLLFSDADIAHDPANLARLVARAEAGRLSLVSLMVRLRCESFWERWLIPAFVFFFRKLYPFRWVNAPGRSTAAAAGGCILIRTEALQRSGGLESIRQALIDDCSLARLVKDSDRQLLGEGRLWLGLSDTTVSLRAYPGLESIWTMVSRTAFSQLQHSPWWLLGAVLGMGLIYLMPPLGLAGGLLMADPLLIGLGLAGWLLMAIAYAPMLHFYRLSRWRALALPAIALLYTLMTLDSARLYWRGRGGAWKGRTYAAGRT